MVPEGQVCRNWTIWDKILFLGHNVVLNVQWNQFMQGQRILSLLVENLGRVHQGGDLDNQRKGEDKDDCQFLLLNYSICKFFL